MSEEKKVKVVAKAVKTIFLTGGTGEIGKAIAYGLAKLQHNLILAARTKEKGESLVADVVKHSGNKNVCYALLDLSSKKSIGECAEHLAKTTTKLDVLLNNAATVTEKLESSVDGLELMFATNVFSYYLLMNHLRPLLKAGSPSRIVNVASNYAGGLDMKDLQSKSKKFDSNTVYQQNKQANRMLSWTAAKLFADDKIAVHACHPGVVTSGLLSNLGMKEGFDTPDSAAATPIFLATDSSVEGKTGLYWDKCKPVTCAWQKDQNGCAALWDYCTKLQ
jgi:NAD(P)-dependent dehydrogenase (short-subunit alcohol dehydrogenase family)